MTYNRSAAALLGAATCIPLVIPLLFIVWFWHAFSSANALDGGPNMAPAVAMILAAAIVAVALGLFYLWHAMTTPRLEGNQRFAWSLGLLLGHVTVMPVYWWLHIWRPAMDSASGATA